MSEESEARGSIPPEEQQPGGSKSPTCGQSSATINVEQLSRLMAMVAQQGDVMAECMNEKIEELFEMSEESEARGSIPPEEQQPGGSKSPTCGQSSATINVEQLSRLMAMVAQQGDVMAECMNEVRQVRDNEATLNTRVTDVET
ncbi:unnamed protein product [Ceratitis capitata]|uniref:(Mediterranean fruit fly) hypothetical protein n=1 Tax=Ceratitis capitata TaxID=7213 RepID=A0A811UWW1_CERCA|nr:unnamed protein product [Ceratitis capitata]